MSAVLIERDITLPPPSLAQLPFANFNWKKPDYSRVLRIRSERLQAIRNDPQALAYLRVFYRHNPIQFIIDWGCTSDPRLVSQGLPPLVPFIPFAKQVEWLQDMLDAWYGNQSRLTEKSRESGVSWLAVALSCTLCLFLDGMVIGMGSRKEEYVDKLGDQKSLFEKARIFMENLPIEFRGGWDRRKHSPYKRVLFPLTGSSIVGEAGDEIGRGARTSIYFVDEAAFLERPHLIESSLASTTNCRIDISTPQGMGNVFAQKRWSGRVKVFTFHWRDDPRKDDAWYAKQVEELDPVTVAQEIDISYTASVENIIIPAAWVNAAVNAHEKLGIPITGMKRGALDIADKGVDSNAMAFRHGILLDRMYDWSGKNSDTYHSVTKAVYLCDEYGTDVFDYDADGIGALVRGDTRNINEARLAIGRKQIQCYPFQSSGKVYQPEGQMVARRKNKDYFANAKAQAWWSLRIRFKNTHQAVVDKLRFEPDQIISLNPKIPKLSQLCMELSQPTYNPSSTGKIVVDKMPDGTRSPNMGDATMIAFAPSARAWEAWARLAG